MFCNCTDEVAKLVPNQTTFDETFFFITQLPTLDQSAAISEHLLLYVLGAGMTRMQERKTIKFSRKKYE